MYRRESILIGVLACAFGLAAGAQERPIITMDERLEQVQGLLAQAPSCDAIETGIRLGLETLYGGLRPVPSKDLLRETEVADQRIAGFEAGFAKALEGVALRTDCPEQQALALDLKLFVEQMNEVAAAVGRVTRVCGDGGDLAEPPCDGLAPLLDEATGHELIKTPVPVIRRGYAVKLRSPFVPWKPHHGWDEDVLLTKPMAPGECTAVFKETRGLMLRLHFERMTPVRDPWATPQLARGTLVPIWSLQWIPSQYVKTYAICNRYGELTTEVRQRVKQDIPLTYFWRFFGKGHHGKHGHDQH